MANKHRKSTQQQYSSRKCKLNSQWYSTEQLTAKGLTIPILDVEQLKGHSLLVSVNLFLPFGKLAVKLNICLLPYVPPIPLLGIYPREISAYAYKKTCTWIFIASNFIHNTPNLETIQMLINRLARWIVGKFIQWNVLHSKKRNQTQKSIFCIIPFLWSSKTNWTNQWWEKLA